VPGIIAPPELVYRPRLDLPAHSGNQDVAGQLEAGFHDRAYGLDVGGNCALHVVGSGAIDPFILDDVGLRLEATACEDGLLAAVRGVEMAVEQELEAVAGPAQLAEGVVAALADFLQTRVKPDAMHVIDQEARNIGFMAGWRRNVHEIACQLHDPVTFNVCQHPALVAFAYRHSQPPCQPMPESNPASRRPRNARLSMLMCSSKVC
jgi:hypothetical protein